jgi:predicted secreted protein
MRISVAVATFFCIWFITLFVVLPFGVRTQGEEGNVVPGTPESAPHKFNFGKLIAVNTAVAAAAFAGVYWVVISI